ncbi:MAG: DNA translocase FtsK 4TM domain-containing protein, partial [Candidatus Neomarinimicrobiota bacterium]|nr:DNA translocase FtsK 4TM domain-containing protein [Candidatus Neomarinimicrobiota bacterium]
MSEKSDIKMKLETIGWLLGFFSLLVLGSLIGHDSSEDPSLTSANINNPFNIIGVYTSYVLVKLGFGYGSYFIPIIGLAISLQLISNFKFELYRIIRYLTALIFLSSITFGLIENYPSFSDNMSSYSGLLGWAIVNLLHDWIGPIGLVGLVTVLWILLVGGFFRLNSYKIGGLLISSIRNRFDSIKSSFPKKKTSDSPKIIEDESFLDDVIKQEDEELVDNSDVIEEEIISDTDDISEKKLGVEDELSIEKGVVEKEVDIDEKREKSIIRKDWKFPSADLLESIPIDSESLSNDYLKERAEFLRNSISTFGVEGKTGSIKTGPIITLFEIEPSEGVRVNKFVQLSDDIARVMEADRVRVLAPIPGT